MYSTYPSYLIIRDLIKPGSRILDLGSGSGDFLKVLKDQLEADITGIEKDEFNVFSCAEKGIRMEHGDFSETIRNFPDAAFDYVIINNSMQEAREIEYVINEALRVGRKVIVGFPNFAYINARLMLFAAGRAPKSKQLPYEWFSTPNLRFLSIRDFREFCVSKGITVLKEQYYRKNRIVCFFPNLLAEGAVFLLEGASEQ